MIVSCFTWFSLLPLLKYCCCHWLIFAIVDNYLIEHRSCNLNSWVRGEPWVSLGTPIHMGSVPCCQMEGEQLHSMASLLLPVVPGHSRLLRQVDSVCWGCCATGTWQIWQLGSYVHPSGWQRCKDTVLLAFENAPLGRIVDSVTCSHSCGKSPSPVVMLHPQRPSHSYVC